jgi:iron complex outermembrane recepter protein
VKSTDRDRLLGPVPAQRPHAARATRASGAAGTARAPRAASAAQALCVIREAQALGAAKASQALRAFRLAACAIVLASLPAPLYPQAPAGDDLTTQSLEDLMNIQVTSVSKKEEKLSRTAAAIFVITQQDIQRSAATNIPDVLRIVPGLDVAEVDGSAWAISARGFNSRFADKLLVMVDGRTVYTPVIGGVFWDVLDMPLEDIERIEVIRGPGGAVWGSNAVNGVINIITKKASETHGGMVTSGEGTVDHGFGTAQYGGGVGKAADYRVYAKYFNQDHLIGVGGAPGADGWHAVRGGFRLDDAASPKDQLTFQGDIYTGTEGYATGTLLSIEPPVDEVLHAQTPFGGGFLQGTWDRTFSSHSETTLNVSYQQYKREDHVHEGRKTLDVDFQHHIGWGARHDFVWGGDYRFSDSHSDGDLTVSMHPPNVNTNLFSLFVQDGIALAPDRLYLTLGTKVERNTYSGWGAMPTIRGTWVLTKNQTAWAAISRALRTPAENNVAIQVGLGGFIGPGGVPVILEVLGNPKFQDETLLAYEAGYRATLRSNLSVDFAAYYNTYGDLQTSDTSAPFFTTTPAPPHLVLPIIYHNLMHGESHGGEAFATWQVLHRWNLSSGYALEQLHMHVGPTSTDTMSAGQTQGSSPVHSAQLRSHVDLSHGWSWDAAAYFVDRLPGLGVPAYTRVDTSLSWQLREGISLRFAGQNLTADHHLEFVDVTGNTTSSLIKRSAYVQFTWKF